MSQCDVKPLGNEYQRWKFATYLAGFFQQANLEDRLEEFFLLVVKLYEDRWPNDDNASAKIRADVTAAAIGAVASPLIGIAQWDQFLQIEYDRAYRKLAPGFDCRRMLDIKTIIEDAQKRDEQNDEPNEDTRVDDDNGELISFLMEPQELALVEEGRQISVPFEYTFPEAELIPSDPALRRRVRKIRYRHVDV